MWKTERRVDVVEEERQRERVGPGPVADGMSLHTYSRGIALSLPHSPYQTNPNYHLLS